MPSVKELKQIKYIFGSFDKLNHYIPSYSDTLKSSWPPDAQKYKMKKKVKLTVKIGQAMFSGEIYYYWPLNLSEKIDKITGKTTFSLHNLLKICRF